MEVLDLYLQGLSADSIVEKAGISKGAVVAIIKDAREGRFPELELKDRVDELHNLSVRLRKGELNLVQVKLGSSILNRLTNMNVEIDKLDEWIRLCSEVVPSLPEGFVPAAVELAQTVRETGKSYAEIISEVKHLSSQRQKLESEAANLEAQIARAAEIKSEIGKSEERIRRLKIEEGALESDVHALDSLLQEKAEELGLPSGELRSRLKELVTLEGEVADRTGKKSRLEGEIEALTERREKLSARIEKASRIVSFLSDPAVVADEDFDLIAIVLSCVDKWIAAQTRLSSNRYLKWDEVKGYVLSRRGKLTRPAQ
jgi:chromosome segregation ATPase